MENKQVNFRASERTVEQLGDLCDWLGESQSVIIRNAIKEKWQQESKRFKPLTCKWCQTPLTWYGEYGWMANCDCDLAK